MFLAYKDIFTIGHASLSRWDSAPIMLIIETLPIFWVMMAFFPYIYASMNFLAIFGRLIPSCGGRRRPLGTRWTT